MAGTIMAMEKAAKATAKAARAAVPETAALGPGHKRSAAEAEGSGQYRLRGTATPIPPPACAGSAMDISTDVIPPPLPPSSSACAEPPPPSPESPPAPALEGDSPEYRPDGKRQRTYATATGWETGPILTVAAATPEPNITLSVGLAPTDPSPANGVTLPSSHVGGDAAGSSQGDTREPWHTEAIYCDLCNMWLSGPTQYADHVLGKKHRNCRSLRRRFEQNQQQGRISPR